ncbi:MAG: ParA family protein, partial [Planctomycetota bacterium]
LTAADEALVPIQAEFFALAGMARFVEVKDLIQDRLNPKLRLSGIVICMWKGQANLSREVQQEVRRVFGDVLFENVIRQNVKLAEAPSAARTIFEHAPESNGAADYAALTVEFLRRHHESVPDDAMDRLLRRDSGPQTEISLEPPVVRVDEKLSPPDAEAARA